MSQENVDLVRRSIDAYNRRDFEALRALNHADLEVDWSASHGDEARFYRGVDEVLRFYEGLLGVFEIRIEADRFIECEGGGVTGTTSSAPGGGWRRSTAATLEGGLALMHPDAEWVAAREHPAARTHRGRDGVATAGWSSTCRWRSSPPTATG